MLIDDLVQTFRSDISIFVFIFVEIAVKNCYISRVAVFANVLALNMSFLSLDQAPRFLVWYGDLGLILGAYGMLCYLLNVKTWGGYNTPAFLLYASLPVTAVVLAAPGDWWIALLIGGAMNAVASWILEAELGIPLVHWEPRPGSVSRFIDTMKMEFVDANGVHQRVDLSFRKFECR